MSGFILTTEEQKVLRAAYGLLDHLYKRMDVKDTFEYAGNLYTRYDVSNAFDLIEAVFQNG